eukprot:141427_1
MELMKGMSDIKVGYTINGMVDIKVAKDGRIIEMHEDHKAGAMMVDMHMIDMHIGAMSLKAGARVNGDHIELMKEMNDITVGDTMAAIMTNNLGIIVTRLRMKLHIMCEGSQGIGIEIAGVEVEAETETEGKST